MVAFQPGPIAGVNMVDERRDDVQAHSRSGNHEETDGSDTRALSGFLVASLGRRLIPHGPACTLLRAAHAGLLAAGRLGFCQQFFRFAQEALSRGVLRPARILHPLP